MCPLNETNKVQPKKSIRFDTSEDDHAKNSLESLRVSDNEFVDNASQATISDDVGREDQYGTRIVKGKKKKINIGYIWLKCLKVIGNAVRDQFFFFEKLYLRSVFLNNKKNSSP